MNKPINQILQHYFQKANPYDKKKLAHRHVGVYPGSIYYPGSIITLTKLRLNSKILFTDNK